MEELDLLLQNVVGPAEVYQRLVHYIIFALASCFVTILIMNSRKKKTQETPVQNRFISLQNRLIKALELEESSFLTEATAIHEEYKALCAAYETLYGGEEQKK